MGVQTPANLRRQAGRCLVSARLVGASSQQRRFGPQCQVSSSSASS